MPPCLPAWGADISRVPTTALSLSSCLPLCSLNATARCSEQLLPWRHENTLALSEREGGGPKNRERQRWFFLVVDSSKPHNAVCVVDTLAFSKRKKRCCSVFIKLPKTVLTQSGCKWTRESHTYIRSHPCCRAADGPSLERQNWTSFNKVPTSQKWKVLKVLNPYGWHVKPLTYYFYLVNVFWEGPVFFCMQSMTNAVGARGFNSRYSRTILKCPLCCKVLRITSEWLM